MTEQCHVRVLQYSQADLIDLPTEVANDFNRFFPNSLCITPARARLYAAIVPWPVIAKKFLTPAGLKQFHKRSVAAHVQYQQALEAADIQRRSNDITLGRFMECQIDALRHLCERQATAFAQLYIREGDTNV